MKENTNVRREYKDRLFKFIFGNEEYKENALSLYNAVNNSNYENLDDLKFTTIEDVIFIGMKNDVSLMIDSRMNLYEQQSTFCPNMPVRALMYFGKLYDSYITTNDLNVYGTKLLKLPTPKFVIFYNGRTNDIIDRELKLTASFDYPDESDVEVVAHVININPGQDEGILSRCKALNDYSQFIEKVNANIYNGMTREVAVISAVNDCIENHILEDMLIKHKSEVLGMFLTEYDEEKVMKLFYRDGLEEGRAEGRIEAIRVLLSKMTKDEVVGMGFSPEEVILAQK